MTPGQTLSRLSHKPENLWGRYLLLCIVLSIISAEISAADLVTSSWKVDGAIYSKNSNIGPDQTMTSSLLMTGLSELFREISPEGSTLASKSIGPMLIQEYAGVIKRDSSKKVGCVFMNQSESVKTAETRTFGALRNGSYSATRKIGPGLTQLTDISGSGLVSLWQSAYGNQSLIGRTVLSGNITGQELIELLKGDQ